jgi:DNA end-binding protein Ku
MSRGLWKGHISFGLVTIPVAVVSAESKKQELDFDLLDRRDRAHVGYQKVNKKTGEVIENEDIVKGLKLDSGKYAIFETNELSQLRIKGTNSIDIQQFIGRDEVDPIYFKKFYYLEPTKGGEKTYVLLRETLRKTHKFAVGLIVLHGRQQLVLMGAEDEAIALHVVHYAQEIKAPDELDVPGAGLKSAKISEREVQMAEKLVEDLTEKWKPEAFRDTYFQQIKAALRTKSRKKVSADDETVATDTDREAALSKVLDLMPLLEKSLRGHGHAKGRATKRAPRS